jgi:hypothetical protein
MKTVKTLKRKGKNLTEKAEIPKHFNQKCSIISKKGGLFPELNSEIIE